MAKDPASLAALNRLLAATEPMVKGGIRAVPGEGPLNPDIAFVGEQPGDQEDLAGKPFVGPAGKLLDKAMAEAGIDRPGYITIHLLSCCACERRIRSKGGRASSPT